MLQIRGLQTTLVGLGAILGATLLVTSTPVLAQTEGNTIRGEADADDNFGKSVGLSGSHAVVGAHLDDQAGANAGKAYMFEFNGSTWNLITPVELHPANAGDQFGFSAAIDGDTAVIGAPFHTDSGIASGAVWVYHWSGVTWGLQQKLLATGRLANDRFGDSVAIEGDRIVVGGSQQGVGPGKAWVFDRSGIVWSQTGPALTPGSSDQDLFGESVALSGDTIIVGARLDDGVGNAVPDCGAAYVFVYNGLSWSPEQTIRAFDADASDQFGTSVGVSGNTAVVGATGDDGAGNNSGAVYVFERSGTSWSQSEKLINFFTDLDDEFGNAIAIDGNRFVAGARVAVSGPGQGTGHVAIYQRVGLAWQEDPISPVAPIFSGATDGFGTSVAIDGTLMLGGAPANSDFANSAGSATFFEVDLSAGGDTDGDGLLDADEILLAGGGSCPDPFDADSDNDGLSDGMENFTTGTNPCLADTDGDGLNDPAEINTHGTDPAIADTDGDGLNDGPEVNTHGTNPLDDDSDDDTLTDGVEIGLGTDPNLADTDGDGLNDAIEAPAGCPYPTNCDSDGDGLADGIEVSANWDPCDSDTDGDTLADGDEVNVHLTDPNDPDTDDDSLGDGVEVALAAGGSCPDPLNPDSDGDLVLDGNEVVGTCGPCDIDTDNDGLCDEGETIAGTNPNDPDSDDDGLLDGAEIASGCTNPLVADTDSDTLVDGAETTTDPCDADSDDDSLQDNIDPNPMTVDSSQTVLTVLTVVASGAVFDTPVDQFAGPNANVQRVRRTVMGAQLLLAAIAINNGNYNAAQALLTIVENRIDGMSPPADWMTAGLARDMIHDDVACLLTLLDLLN